jgi:hypothetical protein
MPSSVVAWSSLSTTSDESPEAMMTSCVDLKTHKERMEIYFDVGVSGPKDGDSCSFFRTEATNVPSSRPSNNAIPLEFSPDRVSGVISVSVKSRIQISGVKLQLRTRGNTAK